jgi:hypothetical protein
MSNAFLPQSALSRVAARFPDKALLIRRLFLANDAFRTICEDYALAQDTLVRFENEPDAEHRPEVMDYQSVVSGLESEIAALLQQTT